MAALTEKRVELLERASGPLSKRNRQYAVMMLDLSIEYDMYSISFVDSAEGMRCEFRRRSAQERADGVEALPPNIAAAAQQAAEKRPPTGDYTPKAAKTAAGPGASAQNKNKSQVLTEAADKMAAAPERFTVKEPAKASAKAEKRKGPPSTALVVKNALSACGGGGGGGGRASPPSGPRVAKSPRTSEPASEYDTDEETAAAEVAALQRRAAERGVMNLPGRRQEQPWQEVIHGRRSRSRSPLHAPLPPELMGLPVGSKEREVAQSLANDAAHNKDEVQCQRSQKALQGLVRAARARVAQPKPVQPAAGRGKGRAG